MNLATQLWSHMVYVEARGGQARAGDHIELCLLWLWWCLRAVQEYDSCWAVMWTRLFFEYSHQNSAQCPCPGTRSLGYLSLWSTSDWTQHYFLPVPRHQCSGTKCDIASSKRRVEGEVTNQVYLRRFLTRNFMKPSFTILRHFSLNFVGVAKLLEDHLV